MWSRYLTAQVIYSQALIADPMAGNFDQANRIAPYLSAFGRKLDAILQIGGVSGLLERLIRLLKGQDPDQVLFEILVGATYVEDGWVVTALPPNPDIKSPDFEVKQGVRRYEVECKRFTRRAEYSEKERDVWLRMWNPLARALHAQGCSLVLSIAFHVELHRLPVQFLVDCVSRHFGDLKAGREVHYDGVSISAEG